MGFGPSTIWALPAGYGSYQPLDEPLYQSTNCYSNTDPTYATLDIDGDLKPDLVVSRRCSDPDVGKTKWLVHKNTGAGFAASATTWALPAGYGSYQPLDEPLYQSTNCYSNTERTYATLDIDGDLKPDLVVSRRCSDPDVGKTKWLVYENSP